MPKAVINDSEDLVPEESGTESLQTPVRINSIGTPLWYKIVMFGLMIIGVLWLVVFYVAGNYIPFMQDLGAWNMVIGFGLMTVGLLMTMGWK